MERFYGFNGRLSIVIVSNGVGFMKAVVIQGASASKRIHSRIYITAEIGAVHEP